MRGSTMITDPDCSSRRTRFPSRPTRVRVWPTRVLNDSRLGETGMGFRGQGVNSSCWITRFSQCGRIPRTMVSTSGNSGIAVDCSECDETREKCPRLAVFGDVWTLRGTPVGRGTQRGAGRWVGRVLIGAKWPVSAVLLRGNQRGACDFRTFLARVDTSAGGCVMRITARIARNTRSDRKYPSSGDNRCLVEFVESS